MAFYENELYHYGIKGMKWGVRRYQNPDGTLTAEGRKRAKDEYRSDNKEAFERGKSATVYGRASDIASKRASLAEGKLNKAYEKDPQGATDRTKRLKNRYEDKKTAAEKLAAKAKETREDAERHCNNLIEKYGKEAITSIMYDDNGRVNENVNTVKDWVEAGALTVTSRVVSTLLGLPISTVYYPASKNTYARRVVNETITDARNERKKKEADKAGD